MCNLPISKRNLPPPPTVYSNKLLLLLYFHICSCWTHMKLRAYRFHTFGFSRNFNGFDNKRCTKIECCKKNTTASLFSHWPGTLDPEMDRIKEGPKNLSVSQALGVRGVITIPIKTSHHFYKYVDKISLAYFSPKMSTSPTPPLPEVRTFSASQKKTLEAAKVFFHVPIFSVDYCLYESILRAALLFCYRIAGGLCIPVFRTAGKWETAFPGGSIARWMQGQTLHKTR